MNMTPRLRKFILTVHIIATIGWIGAVITYIPIAIEVLSTQDTQMVRYGILLMKLVDWYVIIPISFASLLSGVVISVGTPWGLFRHYWVLFKFLLNIFAVFVLLEYTRTLSQFAFIASKGTLSSAEQTLLKDPGHIIHSCGGLILLIVSTVLGVYKPRGMTKYGLRKQQETRHPASVSYTIPRWVKGFGITTTLIILLFVTLRFTVFSGR